MQSGKIKLGVGERCDRKHKEEVKTWLSGEQHFRQSLWEQGHMSYSVCLDRGNKTKEAEAERKERRDVVTVAKKAFLNVHTVESSGMNGTHV